MPRPRKPNTLKVLQGTDKPYRMHDEPDVPVADDFTPPDDLHGPDALKAWGSITTHLGAARVLAKDDLLMLIHFCNLHGRCLRLWRAGESPTAAELTQLRLMAGEFGLTPASRSKAGSLGEGEEANPFGALAG